MRQSRVLIDADEFFNTFPELAIAPYIDTPIVEAEERKTAKWAWVEEEAGTAWATGKPIYDAHFQCSECGFRPFENLNGDEVLTRYCPNCGAKMENPDEEEGGAGDEAN